MNSISIYRNIFVSVLLGTLFVVAMMMAESQVAVLSLIVLAAVSCIVLQKKGVIRKLGSDFASAEKFANGTIMIGALATAVVFAGDHFILLMLTTVLIYVVACLGLNIQFGYAGMVNFAGAAFFGAGGYAAAVLTMQTGLPHLVVLVIGGLVAVIVGFLLILPVLRTRGHYAAVVTIAFSLLFRTLVEVSPVLGGAQGSPVTGMVIFGWNFNEGYQIAGFDVSFYINYFLFALILTAVTFTIVRRVERSWIGLNMDSIRIDETASACFGMNVARWKVTAFTIGNFFMGIIGAFYAMMLGFIAPNNFTFGDSLIMVSIILLGGIGSIWGIILATGIVIILPEKLQIIQEYRFLIFSLGVILVLLYRPNGLLSRAARTYFPGLLRGAR
ncbi:branched-chain amino acid ABC transporter permease [Sneathiella sp.]|uniref:branched-chain amino acid ABC transporter permease n=1 Tax=Sneathiella sp. TaxID=1964365 RepID=UPI00261CF283|nr:branched-chain amino acid ABC transporter permease [Sneathiella sp.]MDF2365650.1 branched-chain amino acid ABC transporter permease [Sneathiella sp.]